MKTLVCHFSDGPIVVPLGCLRAEIVGGLIEALQGSEFLGIEVCSDDGSVIAGSLRGDGGFPESCEEQDADKRP